MATVPLQSQRINQNAGTQCPQCLNQIRFVCNDGDKRGIHIKSNLDATHCLDSRTDESISWTDQDVVVIQNKLERACEILLESIRLPEGRRAIFKPSRQASFVLVDKQVSHLRSERELILGPGESCVLTSSCWTPQGGTGRRMPV